MESTPNSSRGFTCLEVAVVLFICLVVLALLLPSVRMGAGEAARRTQCSNNLKQIGLAVQNYHDIHSEICPSYLTHDDSPAAAPQDFAAWTVLLMPYMEQMNVYDLGNISVPLSEDAPPPADHKQLRTTSLGTYFCPSRRPPQLTANSSATVGDYAAVSRADAGPGVVADQPRTWDAAMLPSRRFNRGPNAIEFEEGMLQSCEFRSMTNFSSILDGLSNTVFIGEKAVHRQRMGGNAKDFQLTLTAGEQDGTYYYGSGGHAPANLNAPGAIAYWSRALSSRPGARTIPLEPTNEDPQNRFGSWHPGISLFALGDGSVRQVNNATSSTILQRLGSRNDRLDFRLP